MNRLSTAKRVAVVAALVEGNSIRATSRMTNVCKPAILKLLPDLGLVCGQYMGRTIRNLRSRRIQIDEIWQYVGAKAKNVPKDKRHQFGIGDTWTWVALDADSKLIVSWLVGRRDFEAASALMNDLSSRVANRVQMTTDGFKVYADAVSESFGEDVDYAMLKKIYGFDSAEVRYSPAKIVSTTTEVIQGNPNPKYISTSYVERQNLTMRMSLRRFTRLTNGFSKKIENHVAAIAIHYIHYNFARIHQTLRVTPAMAAGLSDHVWSIEEIVGLLEARESEQAA